MESSPTGAVHNAANVAIATDLAITLRREPSDADTDQAR